MSLGKRVKEYREKNNIDQKDFAEKIEVTQPYLSHLENGKIEASERVQKRIMKILENETQEIVDNLELLRTMFLVIMMFGTINSHKKNMIGVILKSMITDVIKTFEDFKTMWLREIDDSVVRLEESGAC